MEGLYAEFIRKLKKLYSDFDEEQKRFEKTSNSEIARELCYSDAQFSRLVNGSASDGEYQRGIKNVDRILKEIELEQRVHKLTRRKDKATGKPVFSKVWFWVLALLSVIVLSFALSKLLPARQQIAPTDLPRDYTLQWAFESSSVKPYTRLNDLPDDCNFPCYKFQGRWELKDEYKIPLFGERAGFHYVAKEVRMYARCMVEKSAKGDLIEGYEYQKHEIWFDKRELHMDSFLVAQRNTEIRPSYKALDFYEDANFVKIAEVHTFFRNEFKMDSLFIRRSGKVIGRDIEYLPTEQLEQQLSPSHESADIIRGVREIVRNRLVDFSRPITCEEAPFRLKNFDEVKDGDTLSFDCFLTTNRVPVAYQKIYQLRNQFIKNNCRPSGVKE